MGAVPWDENINFSSVLLLHSCITIIPKEFLNAITLTHRHYHTTWDRRNKQNGKNHIRGTFVLDAYTSPLTPMETKQSYTSQPLDLCS